jgi:hypothetical protein
MQLPMFKKLADGYLSTAGQFLTKAEKAQIAFSGSSSPSKSDSLPDRFLERGHLFPHPSSCA